MQDTRNYNKAEVMSGATDPDTFEQLAGSAGLSG